MIEPTIVGDKLSWTDGKHLWSITGVPVVVVPGEPPVEPPTPPPSARTGVWLSQKELEQRPDSGPLWESVLSAAKAASASGANIADQNGTHDVATLAAALAGVRLNDQALISKAVAGVVGAIGTEEDARWLAVGRQLGAYIIAADLLNLRAGQHGESGAKVETWLRNFYTRTLRENNGTAQVTLKFVAFKSGSNASAQQGFCYAALAAYLNDKAGLADCWDKFRRYAGDRTSPHKITSNNDAWQAIPSDPVGIQNKGATKGGINIDGAISNDMHRGGENLSNPGYTSYPWVGLSGAVPCALVLHRAGYPAWDVADKALLRAAQYLHRISAQNAQWYDASRAAATKHLINMAYGVALPCAHPVGVDQCVGFSDWSHP